MVVNPYSTSIGTNPFNKQAASSPSTSSASSFEEQLSTAIADSLRKLGVAPGELNITVRNTGMESSKQIVISYNPLETSRTSTRGRESAPPESTTTTTPVSTNPFTHEPPIKPQATPSVPESPTPWSPYDGPQDKRDALPSGGGAVTTSGAPSIMLNSAPTANQYNYAGPAARNPYFTTPSNPLREGYVTGFDKWFTQPFIFGADVGPIPANKMFYSTAEGAEEALRIAQQFEPDAQIEQKTWGGGPFSSNIPMYCVSLPGGRLVSAGGILASYYNGGQGVTTESDTLLSTALRLA